MSVIAALLALLLPAAPAAASTCWRPPVSAAVADPYRPPACAWCPGNRGITFAAAPGSPVQAAASGTVTFAGPVAGVRYVVVELPNGWRHTYGNLAPGHVGAGVVVLAGASIGTAAGELHFGLRDATPDGYLDPTPYLGSWRFPTRLIPRDGPAPPAPPPVLECVASVPGAR